MQEIVYCLQHGPGASDRRDKPLEILFPYMELQRPDGGSGLDIIKTLPRPRNIKTHLASNFFKRQLDGQSACPKFVVVLRNPKDVLTSYYHFHKLWRGDFAFPKDWDYFFGMFKEKRVAYGDYFDHTLGWWNYRNHPRVLVVKYEDMKKDAKGNIQKVGEFLECQKYSNDDLDTIVNETSFNKMKSRPLKKTFQLDYLKSPSDFFRQGKVGSWNEMFKAEQAEYVDKRVHSELNSVGLNFDIV